MRVNIVYLDTYDLVGCYVMGLNRIEISKHLFNMTCLDLGRFILRHEREHGRMYQEGKNVWHHLWLDMKDRFKLSTNQKLLEQRRNFNALKRVEGTPNFLFLITYNFFSQWIQIIVDLISIPIRLVKLVKKKFDEIP